MGLTLPVDKSHLDRKENGVATTRVSNNNVEDEIRGFYIATPGKVQHLLIVLFPLACWIQFKSYKF
jgi:hypothetical protein